MRSISIITTLLATLSLAAPVAFAEGSQPEEHIQVIAEFDANGDHFYIVDHHGAVSLFRETNGLREAGQASAITGEPTGLQATDVCAYPDGTYTYQGDEDEGTFDPEFCSAPDATLIEADEQITNGVIVGMLQDLLA